MRTKRMLVFCMSTLVLISVFFLKISAQDSYVTVSEEHFLSESFSSENATLSTNESGYLNINFRRVAPVISAKLEFGIVDASQNAVRLVLINNSACNSFLFTYEYLDSDGRTQSATEKISLGSRGVRNDYYIYTDVADRITQISIAFSGISSGSIVVMSLDFLSVADNSEDVCGTLNSCVYNRENSSVEISGTIKYEFVTKYRTAKLVLYAVDMETTALLYGTLPLASTPMSSHFDFLLSDISLEERMMGYVVAIVSEGGELLYNFDPRVPISKDTTKDDERFLKGIRTDHGILAARANAKLAVVDVDFAKLVSQNVGEGLLYAFSGEYFYFNRQYISSLDAEIQKSYENGMKIVLRLVSSEKSADGLSKLIAHSKEERFRLYAYTAFLCNRYRSNSRGVVSSIIYGNCADDVYLSEMSQENYTRLYADSLFAVYEAAAATGRDIKIIVSISDHLEKGKTGVSPRVFLVSLGNILQKKYSGDMNVAIMVESNAISGEGSSYGQLGFENIGEFSVFLGQLHDAYPMISEKYLYYWEPPIIADRELLKASLLHGYSALACEKASIGFVFSTESISDLSLVAELMSALQFVDTPLGEKNSIFALAALHKDDWTELIVDYSDDKIKTVNYREVTDAITAPFRFLGECYLWDFSGMGNDYGWNMGDGCESVVMEKNDETNRALAARMQPLPDNNYESELIYYFDEIRSFATVDAVSLDVRIDAPAGKYRITVQICSDTAISEAHLLISSNTLSKMYVNTAGLFAEEDVRCIRIFTTPVSGNLEEYKLSIGSISAHSTNQRTDLLEKAIKPTQGFYEYNESTRTIEPFWIYTIVLVAFVSVILIVALYFRSEEEI